MTLTLSRHMLLIAFGLLAYCATPQAQARDATRIQEALAKNVRVTHVDGTRTTGMLLSLSPTEVVLRQDHTEKRVALTNVDRVVRVRHRTRSAALWAAAVAGGTAAALTPVLEDDGGGDAVGFILSWAGLAGAAGAGIGAAINLANRDDDILYLKSRAPSIAQTPGASVHGARIRLSITW